MLVLIVYYDILLLKKVWLFVLSKFIDLPFYHLDVGCGPDNLL